MLKLLFVQRAIVLKTYAYNMGLVVNLICDSMSADPINSLPIKLLHPMKVLSADVQILQITPWPTLINNTVMFMHEGT